MQHENIVIVTSYVRTLVHCFLSKCYSSEIDIGLVCVPLALGRIASHSGILSLGENVFQLSSKR